MPKLKNKVTGKVVKIVAKPKPNFKRSKRMG